MDRIPTWMTDRRHLINWTSYLGSLFFKMFDRLQGILSEIKEDRIIIETPSFFYNVFISLRTIQDLPALGEKIIIFLYPIFKENDIILYGFTKDEDRQIFTDLISVNKVGPRTALSLLSLYDRDQLIRFITEGRVTELTRANGIGKKGAELIITVLKDKYKNVRIREEVAGDSEGAIEKVRISDQVFNDAVSALTSLGFSWESSSDVVRSIYTEGIEVEDLVRDALMRLNS